MKMKILIKMFSITLAVLLLTSCKKNETKLWSNDNLSALRTAYGITGYRDICVNNESITFNIVANPTELNYVNFNLNNALVEIHKSQNTVLISIKQQNGVTHNALFDKETKKISFKHSNSDEIVVYDHYKSEPDSIGLDCIDPVCAENYNASIASILIVNDASIHHGEASINFETYYGYNGDSPPAPCNNPYYGYTIGWGFTSEEAQDHEQSVRNWPSTRSNLLRYSCNALGTSTNCLWENVVCMAVSTYRCCK